MTVFEWSPRLPGEEGCRRSSLAAEDGGVDCKPVGNILGASLQGGRTTPHPLRFFPNTAAPGRLSVSVCVRVCVREHQLQPHPTPTHD